MHHKETCRGFSLMDVLIAVAIVAILATLAYPNYRSHMERGRRLDAVNALLGVQVAQEQWRANHPQYADLEDLDWIRATSAEGHYRLSIEQRSAGSFLAVAQPRRDGPQRDDACGTFAVDQNGPVYEDYADADCWRR